MKLNPWSLGRLVLGDISDQLLSNPEVMAACDVVMPHVNRALSKGKLVPYLSDSRLFIHMDINNYLSNYFAHWRIPRV